MSEKTRNSISDRLYRTKEATEEHDYDIPGYITSSPEDGNGGKIIIKGVLPDGSTKWKHTFESPEDWSDGWDIVRFIESDEFKWDASTFDGEFIIDEAVPLVETRDGYKIDIPEPEKSADEVVKGSLHSVTEWATSHDWKETILLSVWILTLLIIALTLVVMV